MGGGLYDEGGKELKIGNWIDVGDGFSDRSLITFDGEYKNGQKVGRWVTLFNLDGNNKQMQIIIHKQTFMVSGGGEFDELHGVKIGNWIDISEGFYQFSQVTFNGEYKNGKKVGRWNIYYNNILIGGGQYDEGNQEAKIGNWIEISSEFSDWSQVTFEGNYKNGQKFGKWNIWFRNCNMQEQKLIGGGSYDEGDQALKVGNWIEIIDGFKSETQVTYRGEYQNGIKIGKWEIWGRNNFDNPNTENIGGGLYDQGEKVGNWIEINDGFLYLSDIIYNGNYKNGQKIGIWEELDVYNKEKLNEVYYDH